MPSVSLPSKWTVSDEALPAPASAWIKLALTVRLALVPLEAKVIDISPDVLQDQRGGLFYRVRLKAQSASFGPGKPVIPGMTGEVAIKSGSQTILSYILGPLIRVRDGALHE